MKLRSDKSSKPLQTVKIELIEFYRMQLTGIVTMDNKEINELTTSASEDFTSSSESDSDELKQLRSLMIDMTDDDSA